MARDPALMIGTLRARLSAWFGEKRGAKAPAGGVDGVVPRGMMPDIPGLPAGLKREQPLIPVDSAASRALVAVIAILTFLAALAGGAAHMVARASSDWRSAVSNEMTIQIKPDVRRSIEDDLKKAADLFRGAAGVEAVRIVPRAESDRLLEPWLGTGFGAGLGTGLGLAELPVPRLVIVTIARGSRPDNEALRQSLRREVPGASLDDHRLWIGRLSTMANTLILAGVVVVILVTAAAGLAVAFATRGAMAGSQDSVEVLHLVGADDSFIAREFQGRFLKLGLEGGAIGGLVALVVTAVLGWISLSWSSGPGADQLQALFGSFEIGWIGYLIVILIAAMVALIAGLVSRLTVRRHLKEMA
ncbi:MAG: ABC transporter permease [Beijerinckiaceae bacterium]|jgi:cell division transport system permease protein|nr:ABC transporter permease [Beijerinckiaceae bacterium]